MNILKEIPQCHWVWFWSGNWPLLDGWYYFSKEMEDYFVKFCGIPARIMHGFYVNGIATEYHAQEEYDKMEAFLLKKFEKDPDFIMRSIKDHGKLAKKDITALKKIRKIQVTKKSNEEIIKIFKKTREHFIYNSSIDIYVMYIEKFFVPILQKYLEKRLKELSKSEKLPEYMETLIMPIKPSRVFKQRTELFIIIEEIRKNKEMVKMIQQKKEMKALFDKYPVIAKKIEEHVQKHCWLHMVVNAPLLTKEELWEEITKIIDNNEPFTIKSRRIGDNYNPKIKEKKQKLIDELHPDEKMRTLIKSLAEIAFIRTEDNAVGGESSYQIIPLYNEIAKRLGISYQDLKQLTPEEVVSFLEKGKNVAKPFLQERYQLTYRFKHNGERGLYFGKEADKCRKAIEKQIKKGRKDKDVFYGTPASLGKATGRVKLGLSYEQAMKIKQGEILVAPSTSAYYVPAMRKAAAIITEFGGMTSHAGIVARETKVPCIVGVERITTILKDGDLIEVDADKGIIKKVK